MVDARAKRSLLRRGSAFARPEIAPAHKGELRRARRGENFIRASRTVEPTKASLSPSPLPTLRRLSLYPP